MKIRASVSVQTSGMTRNKAAGQWRQILAVVVGRTRFSLPITVWASHRDNGRQYRKVWRIM